MDGDSEIRFGKPVLAVLPIVVTEGDGDATLIAEGVHEDICGELTRFRGFQVISPASTAVVAGLSDDEVGSRLQASHVLRGRIRRIGTRLRLTASLISVRGAAQLWTEHFDLVPEEVIAFEDKVIARIAATLNVKIEEAALSDARRRPLTSLAAYELTLRGMALVRQGTVASNDAAVALFEQALALDPFYARAHSGLSLCWFNQWNCQFWDRFDEASLKAYLHARESLEIDDSDAMNHLVIAQIALFRGAWEQAAWYLDRALMLCPNDADLLIQAAVLEVFLGRAPAAAEHVEHAMQINPYHSNEYFAIAAMVAIFSGDLERGIENWARCDTIPMIDIPAYAAAAHAHLDQIDAARTEFDRYLAGYREKIAYGADFAKDAPLRWLFEVNPFRRSEDIEFLKEGFRKLDHAVAAPVNPPKPSAPQATLAPTSAGWIAEFEGRRVIIADLKGLRDIRRLLEVSGQEIHCLDLAEREAAVPGGDAMLDQKARNALKTRMRDLQEDLAEAEGMNDIGRAERLRTEIDSLLDTLKAALGLGGRSRRLGDAAEKARTAVTWRIRHALTRITQAHPELGRHLAHSLRTGTFCSYQPETSIAWRFSDAPTPVHQRGL